MGGETGEGGKARKETRAIGLDWEVVGREETGERCRRYGGET